MYWLTLYNQDGVERKTWRFDRKSEQMEKYWNLINRGHRKSDIEKGKYLI